MYGGGAGRKSHDTFGQRRQATLAMVYKLLEIGFETVDVRSQGHNPVVSEGLLDIFHFIARHVGKAQNYTFAFHNH